MKKARLIKGKLHLKFTGSDFNVVLNNIKNLPYSDRRYDPVSKEWVVTNTKDVVENLKDWGFELPDELVKESLPDVDEGWKHLPVEKPFPTIRSYQQDGLRFLKYHHGRGLLAFDMGGGKSATALAYLATDEAHFPALIVAPAPTKPGWKKQYEKFFGGKRIHIVYGMDDVRHYGGLYDIVIINYELLSLHVEKKKKKYQVNGNIREKDTYTPSAGLTDFFNNDFQTIIIDEIQNMANEKSKLYHALKSVGRSVRYLIGLSGTPFNNKPKELFNFLNLCRPDIFKNRYAYYNRFCDPTEIRVGRRVFKQYNGVSNALELNRLLQNEVMLRYTAEEMLDLPEKNVIAVPVEMANPAAYEALEAQIIAEIKDETNRRIAMERFEVMKQEAYKQKKESAFSFIDMKLKDVDKIVVFATHTEVVEDILTRYGDKALRYDGKISTSQKEENKTAFIQNQKVHILVANIKAGGTGVDGLQDIANTMIFLEFPWTKTLLDQAIARLHRDGQKGRVTAYLLVAEGSIDEEIATIIDTKADLMSRVVDGVAVTEGDLIHKLLEKYRVGLDNSDR